MPVAMETLIIGGCAHGTDWRLCSWHRLEVVLVLAQIGGCARGTDWWRQACIDITLIASIWHRFGIDLALSLASICFVGSVCHTLRK